MTSQAPTSMDALEMQTETIKARQIPPLEHDEAGQLAREELSRFLTVVEDLSGDDWQQPTDCDEWSVRDILAHQAGAYAGFARWGDFIRQMSARPGPDQAKVDAINARQLADRTGRGPAELIDELRQVGPKAINIRQRLPWLLRKLPLPLGQPIGTALLGYLTDLIYPRDTWMHRADICRATDRTFHQTPDHDGRIVALVLCDLADEIAERLRDQSVIFNLTGPAGGRFHIGPLVEPSAILKMELLEFNRLASDRLSATEARTEELVTISGDHSFADQVLSQTSIPY